MPHAAPADIVALGVREDIDSVALMLRNDFATFEANMAAGQLGAYAVPINWHFTPEEAGYILRDCAAKVLVAAHRPWRRSLPATSRRRESPGGADTDEIAACLQRAAREGRQPPAAVESWDAFVRCAAHRQHQNCRRHRRRAAA